MHVKNKSHSRKSVITALIALAFCVMPLVASADVDEERQYKVEVAFLYNFFNYITWPGYTTPQELKKPVICIYGNDPVEPYLYYIQSKMAATRHIDIQKIKEGESAEICNILFVRDNFPDSELRKLASGHTLTVSEHLGAINKGGMIELARENEHISMKINESQLEKNNFQISSRLLHLAEEVK